jgi:hypothetical protein
MVPQTVLGTILAQKPVGNPRADPLTLFETGRRTALQLNLVLSNAAG